MKNYFHLNEIMLKVGGLHVPPKGSKLSLKVFYLVYNSFWIIYSGIVYIVSEVMLIPEFRSDLAAYAKILNLVMTDLLSDLKIFLWFYNRKKIIKITETLDAYAEIYESFEEFVPDRIIEKERKVKDAVGLIFLTCGLSVVISACVMVFIGLISSTSLNEDGSRNLEHLTLPYLCWTPLDHKKSLTHYGFAVLFQLLPVFNLTWIIVGFDSTYMAIIGYTSAHLFIIQGAFRTLRERCLVKLGINVHTEFLRNPPNVQRAMDEEIVKITKHLQAILETTKEIESLFTFVVLCQTMTSLGVLCTCLYVVILIPGTKVEVAKDMAYMFAICLETFFYCYFGNKASVSGEDLPLAIYSMDWLAATTPFKRTMLINMMRMQRGIYFTIGKFSPLTLSTFVTILRGSYSFFAVLKNSQKLVEK